MFPPERGALWFAAGLSFTSFSLVYATAVLTVEIHDGLEINLLGLARLALPSPAFADRLDRAGPAGPVLHHAKASSRSRPS